MLLAIRGIATTDRTDLDTGAKPAHAMLPDMGLYHM